MTKSIAPLESRRLHPSTHRRGLTLIELIVVIWVGALLAVLALFILAPSTGSRPLSKRLICSANLKGIGTSMKIYANDNNEAWAAPPFDESSIGSIDYIVNAGGGGGTVRSPDRSLPSQSGPGGARQLSVTRSFWMLVRSGDVTVSQFICPASGDEPDETDDLEAYYDFTGRANISYGFQVPFGPKRTRAHEGMDNRMVLAADKGPYVDATVAIPPPSLAWDASPKSWKPYNSWNHAREGQNVLFADGHVSFERTPTVGVDHDNIYTVATDNWLTASRVRGESPWKRSAHPFAPFEGTGERLASTDSLVFP